MPNIKIRHVGFDAELNEGIIPTRGIIYNKDMHKEIKEFYNEMFRRTLRDELEMYHRHNNNDAILASCYEVLKALFELLYKNDHHEDIFIEY